MLHLSHRKPDKEYNMKKRNKKEEYLLLDLSDRKNIKIIRSNRKTITDKEMKEFETKLDERYKVFSDFTELCIQRNLEANHKDTCHEDYEEAMKSMLEQNKLLEDMIKMKEQEN